jgi:peroxiredoxin
LRDHYEAITTTGAEVVAIGTGDERYAKAFVDELQVPFPVLFDPRSIKGARRAHREGYRVKKSGKRVNQLGATFVVGPGSHVRYEHVDAHTADHAPVEEVLAALSR